MCATPTPSTSRSSTVHGRLGQIDVLVNAAGVLSFGTADTIDEAGSGPLLDINLKGTWHVARAVLPAMVQRRTGSIVNLASVEGIEGGQADTAYNAVEGRRRAAHAQHGRSLRPEQRPRQLPLPRHDPDTDDRPVQEPGLSGARLVRGPAPAGAGRPPEEVAAAALFLASDDASFVTGHALAVDGGYLAGRRFPGTL